MQAVLPLVIPAENIVKDAIAKGIKRFALPGASAVLPALSVSGFTTAQFQFVGFLPQQPKKTEGKICNKLQNIPILQ